MVPGEFLWISVMTLVVLVISYFVRPHWKNFDPETKFVIGFIPGLMCFAGVMLFVGLIIGFDPY